MDWSKYAPEFSAEEFVCRCGCGLLNMRESHMDRLLAARRHAGVPFKITSGSRCEVHNLNVGGTTQSDHLGGYGSDIAATDSRTRYLVVSALLRAGFTRIGIAKTFVHAGSNMRNAPNVIWLY